MLIRPTEEELQDFGEPDFIIYNAGQFPANRFTKGMSSTTSVEINFKRMEMVILGTEYAGEMKKGVFSVMVSSPPPASPSPRTSGPCDSGHKLHCRSSVAHPLARADIRYSTISSLSSSAS